MTGTLDDARQQRARDGSQPEAPFTRRRLGNLLALLLDRADYFSCAWKASNMKRPSVLGFALIACAIVTNAAPPSPPKLFVLDVELTGDLGGPELASEHQARLNLASTRLRESLSRTGLYQMVDSAPAQKTVDETKSRYRHLHDCNGCDLDLGRQLGADLVLVTWVDRVSGLILSLTYEIHDVATGQITARKSFGFRGDNDTSWTRAIDYMVRDLDESD